MYQNLSIKQRKFLKRFRTGRESGLEIMQDLNLTPGQLMRWMKNNRFRRMIDDAARAVRLMTAWDMQHLAHHGLLTAKQLLGDEKARVQIALRAIQHVAQDLKQLNRPKPAKPDRPMLIHPAQAHNAKELIDAMAAARNRSNE